MDKFDFVSPIDFRYYDKRFAEFLSENARVRYQARVEAALAEALAKQKVCSASVAKEISMAAENVKAVEVYGEEKRIKHDVRALANVLRSRVSKKAKPFVHLGATSYDIVDTASALRFKEATEQLVVPSLKALEKTLIKLSLRYKGTVQIGRTHGQHAVPITFGFALSEYASRLGNRINEIERKKDSLPGKFSGAVGAYNASSLVVPNPVKLEQDIMRSLGLQVSTHSTQIVEPESLADLMHAFVSAFSVLANLADDLRHLQRSEISEVAEEFSSNQVGSSTMPHKRNPINFENVKSLWKEFMPRMGTVYLDSVSEHQRDLTNSASARFLPEIVAGLVFAAGRLDGSCSKLVVDKKAMKENFGKSKEAIVAEPLYIFLASHGHANSHEAVRKLTIKSIESGKGVLELAVENKDLKPFLKLFSKKQLKLLENPETYVGLSVKVTEAVCRHWKKELKL